MLSLMPEPTTWAAFGEVGASDWSQESEILLASLLQKLYSLWLLINGSHSSKCDLRSVLRGHCRLMTCVYVLNKSIRAARRIRVYVCTKAAGKVGLSTEYSVQNRERWSSCASALLSLDGLRLLPEAAAKLEIEARSSTGPGSDARAH